MHMMPGRSKDEGAALDFENTDRPLFMPFVGPKLWLVAEARRQ